MPDISAGNPGEERTRVSCLSAQRFQGNSKSEYATSEDFRKLFTEDAQSLYLLSFLLTADHEKAERCFVGGINDCVDGNSVFHEWARSWARRVIVRNAVRTVDPRPVSAKPEPGTFQSTGEADRLVIALHKEPFAGVLALEDFERFVYVLSVLERYPEAECTALLSVSRREIRDARLRAIRHIADFDREEAEPVNGPRSAREN
jgi:hypothetical protein